MHKNCLAAGLRLDPLRERSPGPLTGFKGRLRCRERITGEKVKKRGGKGGKRKERRRERKDGVCPHH